MTQPNQEQGEPVAYINIEKRRLEWAHDYMSWDTPTVVNLPRIPLYTTPQLAPQGLVPKEILMSHLQRSEGAEEVSLPIDFFRDLLYQAMPRTWAGLHTTTILDIYAETLKEHRGGSMPDGQIAFAKAIQTKLKEVNT